MPCQILAECLYEIFEYLEDKTDLYSCLLVNRLWCKVSVRILWTNIQNYHTLVTCLPNESKEILRRNEIIISTPTSKPPLFNYVAFIKSFSMNEIGGKIKNILKKHLSIRFNNNKYTVVLQEIFKMFMSQISLKNLNFNYMCNSLSHISNIPFTTYPG